MKKWPFEEEKKLAENYNKIPNSELLKLFPGKSYLSIYKKAYKLGLRKDKRIEYMNRSEARKREKGANWRGGRRKTSKGYIQIMFPEHKRADSGGYVMEHIVVFERETGIEVPMTCSVHHINGNKSDNRIENLCMMTNGAHTHLHNKRRKYEQSNSYGKAV